MTQIKESFTFDEIVYKGREIVWLDGLENMDLLPDTQYILTSWNSNSYFKLEADVIKISHHYGEPLEAGKEYLIIKPSY